MKSREQILEGLRNINAEWDDPTLTLLERQNLDSGAVMLMWVLNADLLLKLQIVAKGKLEHHGIRQAVMEFLLAEGE